MITAVKENMKMLALTAFGTPETFENKVSKNLKKVLDVLKKQLPLPPRMRETVLTNGGDLRRRDRQ